MISSPAEAEYYNNAKEIALVVYKLVWILMKAKFPLFGRALLIDGKRQTTVPMYCF